LKQANNERLLIKTVEAHATVVILAGSETSSVAETAATSHILTHPQIYKTLQNKIRGTFASIK
jgi:cytochrome P450